MGPQEVAGKDHLILRQVGEDGIRPVEEGGGDESQRLAPQVQGLPVLHHMEVQIGAVGDALDIDRPRLGGEDGDILPQLRQQFRQGAGVVRLVVVEDDIADALGVADLPDVLEVGLKKAAVAYVDEGGLFAPLYQVGVVGGAVVGGHHDVEHPHGGVQRPHLIDPLVDLLHR